MTNRARKARIQEVREEFLARLKQRFPLVELVNTEERPTGTVVFLVYAPYEDKMDILEVNSERIAELAAMENFHVMVLPVNDRPKDRAA